MNRTLTRLAFGVAATLMLALVDARPSFATDTHTGPNTVGSVICNGAGQYCSFMLNGGRTNQPTCAAKDTSFIFQTNTEGGRALLSLLLTSKVSGYSINVYGTGGCATSTLGVAEEWVDYIVTP